MDNDKELRGKFTKILGVLNTPQKLSQDIPASWEEIFVEIGKLQERANKPPVKEWMPYSPVGPQLLGNQQVHYHNGQPCYKNPCVWC